MFPRKGISPKRENQNGFATVKSGLYSVNPMASFMKSSLLLDNYSKQFDFAHSSFLFEKHNSSSSCASSPLESPTPRDSSLPVRGLPQETQFLVEGDAYGTAGIGDPTQSQSNAFLTKKILFELEQNHLFALSNKTVEAFGKDRNSGREPIPSASCSSLPSLPRNSLPSLPDTTGRRHYPLRGISWCPPGSPEGKEGNLLEGNLLVPSGQPGGQGAEGSRRKQEGEGRVWQENRFYQKLSKETLYKLLLDSLNQHFFLLLPSNRFPSNRFPSRRDRRERRESLGSPVLGRQ